MFGLSLGWFALFVLVAGFCWTVGAWVASAILGALRRGP